MTYIRHLLTFQELNAAMLLPFLLRNEELIPGRAALAAVESQLDEVADAPSASDRATLESH
jgi:hypothetical protein